MALRMHPVSPSRWAQLAASRLPIDLTETATVRHHDRARRLQVEHALIQERIDALAKGRAPANR